MMLSPQPFELAAYLGEKFPSLTIGAGLFYRWPTGIRFELGLEAFRQRGPKLYEAIFSSEDTCVIISQDWPSSVSPAARQRYFQVFSLPGVFDPKHQPRLQSLEITTEKSEEGEEQNFTLQWTQLPARSFDYSAVMEGIANHDHAKTPSVSSRVYFLNPATDMIVHMYDERGLDVIAASKERLIPIYRTFKGWVLDFDREQVAKALSQ
jgi:hypothetical protein